ncbi:MAG TPA: hypothetical protein PKK06_07760 [Phycisphaerae bacterium]|nr:hypothetical protein [Phycisphaerae bacterium]HNU46068.1 hypothetical protein [Phycisphaerae bacterium]
MRDGPMHIRHGAALAANLLAPGVGLIVLRRERLGLALAAMFVLTSQVGLWGLLVIPDDVPPALAAGAATAAGVVWVAAQVGMLVRLRRVVPGEVEEQLQVLTDAAATAIAQQRYADACDLLQTALAVDDEDMGLWVGWARLMTLMGRFPVARQAWERVLHLDHQYVHRKEAIQALERLPRM